MTKLDAIKLATNFIVGAGTTKITGGIIRNNVPVENVIDVVTVNTAAFMIGGMAAEKTKAYTGDQIDKIANLINEFKNKN